MIVLIILVLFLFKDYLTLYYISVVEKSDKCPKLLKHRKKMLKIAADNGCQLDDNITVRQLAKYILNHWWETDKCSTALVEYSRKLDTCPCKES